MAQPTPSVGRLGVAAASQPDPTLGYVELAGLALQVLEQSEAWVPRWVWLALLVVAVLFGVGMTWNAALRARVQAQTRTIEDQLDEMRYLKDAAEAANRAKSAFLADMSHEIRTPLTAIIGFAQVLGEEAEPQDREYARLIEQSGLRLMESINSVLDYARMEAGRVPLSLQPLCVAGQVEEALQTLAPLAKGKGLSLTLDVAPGAEQAHAALDSGGFGRVLNNIVGNAIKFTSEGGVRVAVRTQREQVRISVEDTGPGIGEAFLPRLFGEFQQESAGEERTHRGSGLGLAITRRLVQAMGGTIGVDSVVGKGTVFTVTFPTVAPPA
jgi:signal transduction histidine kinase